MQPRRWISRREKRKAMRRASHFWRVLVPALDRAFVPTSFLPTPETQREYFDEDESCEWRGPAIFWTREGEKKICDALGIEPPPPFQAPPQWVRLWERPDYFDHKVSPPSPQ